MEAMFSKIHQALSKGEDVVLCSIISSSGSTPRGSGAKMAVFENGLTLGTIGGGAIEFESGKLAQRALKEKRTFVQEYNLTSNETADIGMICGGQVTVYFQYLASTDEKMKAFILYMIEAFSREADIWLINPIGSENAASIALYESGKGLIFAEGIDVADIKPLLKSRGVLKKEAPAYFVEPLTQTGKVYVFGGGHVSQELVPVLSHVGFRVAVYEDRPEFATKDLFNASTELIVGSFKALNEHIQLTPNDYVVIMTRGHQADYDVLEQVLRQDVFYVGVIGSRHKKEKTYTRLREAGISELALTSVHSPIGLDIKGETPAEIAISIAAELIQCRAEKKWEGPQ